MNWREYFDYWEAQQIGLGGYPHHTEEARYQAFKARYEYEKAEERRLADEAIEEATRGILDPNQ